MIVLCEMPCCFDLTVVNASKTFLHQPFVIVSAAEPLAAGLRVCLVLLPGPQSADRSVIAR